MPAQHNGLQYHDTTAGTVQQGRGFRFIKNLTGLTYGPVVLFDETRANSTFPTAVVSPMTNINLGAMNVRSERFWTHGPSWELTHVPAGFTHSIIVQTGVDGIRPTLRRWGEFLLAEHNTTRLHDPSLEYLGVFTDNGAFYDAGYWPSFKGNKDASEIFRHLSKTYQSLEIPVHYIQLDDWWYGNQTARKQTQSMIVVCTESFTPTTTTGLPPDASNPPLFPQGLKPLREQFGGGLMLYMVNFCPDTEYFHSQAEYATSFPDDHGHIFLNPTANSSKTVYGRLMDDGIRQGMTLFEIDFMEKNFEQTPYYRNTPGAADGWLAGLSQAAAARNLPTQLCSDSPRDVIASVRLPAVTQFRGSLDYACDCDAEPQTGNWDVGQQSLLISSLALGASKDTFMTNPVEAWINHHQAGNCTVDNGHVELDLFLATLSSGPVGFGDGIGDTNRTLLMRCCMGDGTILRADTALTPIDATWAQRDDAHRPPVQTSKHGPIAAAAVWSAHTQRNGSYFHFLAAIDVPSSFMLHPTDFWPPVTNSVIHRKWHASACANNSKASSCGVVLGMPDAVTGIPANRCQNKTQDRSMCTHAGIHNWELTTVSPVTHGGVALLGELSKVAAVSSARFRSIETLDSGGLRVTIWGSRGEKVEISFVFNVQAEPIVKTWRLLIPPGATTGAAATLTVDPVGSLVDSQ